MQQAHVPTKLLRFACLVNPPVQQRRIFWRILKDVNSGEMVRDSVVMVGGYWHFISTVWYLSTCKLSAYALNCSVVGQCWLHASSTTGVLCSG